MNISQRNIKILFSTSVLYFLLINNIASGIVVITSYNICAISFFYIASYWILSQIKNTSDRPKIYVLHERLFYINKSRIPTAHFSSTKGHSIKALYPIIILLKTKIIRNRFP